MAFWADSERASGSHPSLLSAAGGHRPFTAPARPGHRPGCLRVTVNPPSALDNDAYRFWCPLLRIRDLRRDAERQHARPALSDGTLRNPDVQVANFGRRITEVFSATVNPAFATSGVSI